MSDSTQRRIQWAALLVAPLLPLIGGFVSGFWFDLIPISTWQIVVTNSIYAATRVTPLGFAVWLAWRWPASQRDRHKLFCYALWLGPSSFACDTIFYRAYLFAHTLSWQAFDLRALVSYSGTIEPELLADLLFFLPLLLTLFAIRSVKRIDLARIDQVPRHRSAMTIQSLMVLTLFLAVLFPIIQMRSQIGNAIVGSRDLVFGQLTWMDMLGIVVPVVSGVALAMAFALLAFGSTRRWPSFLAAAMVAFLLLLLPQVIEQMTFSSISLGPPVVQRLPNVVRMLTAFITLLACGVCLLIFRSSGMQIKVRAGRKSVALDQ